MLLQVLIQETHRRQYEGHNTPLGYYTDQGVYCGLSAASEVFLSFTTQLYTFFPICAI